MLPDVDMYPTAIAFLLGRKDLIYVLHRTATHSLLVTLLLAVFGWLLLRARPKAGWIGLGLALGAATHLLLDIFFWFAQIDLFWPFSHLPAQAPLLPVVDLWKEVRPIPDLALNLREAFEFAAFALLLGSLRSIRVRASRGEERPSKLLCWQRAAWVAFAVTVGTAFLLRDRPSLQNILVTTPYLLAFLPYCWLATVRSAGAVARWSTAR